MDANISIERLLDDVQYDDLRGLWWVVERPTEYGFPANYTKSYQSRIDLFCTILEWLLSEGKMRLANHGIFLEGTPAQQADKFRNAFPKSEDEMNEKEAYLWFLDECPGGAVWYTDVDDNGFQTSPTGDGRFYYWT